MMEDRSVYSEDGGRRYSVRQRPDGLFQYVEEYLYSTDADSAGWAALNSSGLFETAEEALEEASSKKPELERPRLRASQENR
jgi:predicted transcriptional regulator